jgi:uroporphyrinogen-III synthase
MHILLTSPEFEARKMKAQLEASGHRVSLAPVLNIVPCLPDELNFHGVHALFVTSANALRALERSPALARARTLPIFVVGVGTEREARRIGFANIHVGAGTGRALASLIRESAAPSDGRLLYLAGETRAFDLAGSLRDSGFDVDMVIAYRAFASSALPADVVRDIGSGEIDTVILMSPRTARVLSALLEQQGLRPAARRLRFICLSENVAAAIADMNPERIEIAGKPSGEEMLALANRMASVSGTS